MQIFVVVLWVAFFAILGMAANYGLGTCAGGDLPGKAETWKKFLAWFSFGVSVFFGTLSGFFLVPIVQWPVTSLILIAVFCFAIVGRIVYVQGKNSELKIFGQLITKV